MAADDLDGLPWQRLESTLLAASRDIRRAYDAVLGELGLNLTQATLLAYVEEFGPITQSQLAERLGMGRAATGAVVDAMHARGLVARDPDPDDRRVWLVRLTDTGKDLVGAVNEADARVRTDLRAGLSRTDRQRLVQLLVKLQENAAGVLAMPR
jgi:DNA-binding MarR family transcriptional regulator